jgi:putative tricarboxylic transport membrane protein
VNVFHSMLPPAWRRLARCGALALALCGLPAAACAQWKPERNVEFVIGTGPGGVFDSTARRVQRIWKETGIVGANTLVVNKPGAGQSLAQAYLNDRAGDGHFLSLASGILFANHLTGRTSYAYTDFTPIAILFNEATVFAVNAGSPLQSGRDLLERLRKDPAGPSFAVGSSLGSATHMAAALAVKAVGGDVRKMKAVVLASSGDSVTQVLGGHIDVVTSAATLVLPHAQAGKLRIIAVASPQRLKGLPDVPTWREQGVDATVPNWRGVIGPRGMSAEQVAYWEQAFARTVKTAEWQAEVAKNLWEDVFMGSREAKRFLDADYALNRSLLAELGLIK